MPHTEFARDHHLWNIDGLTLQLDADLSDLTSMKTRASASILAVPTHVRALRELVKLVRARQWPMMILGGGTNTIFATAHFEGIVTVLPAAMFGAVEVVEENVVRVGAAADLGRLLDFSRKNGLMGLEFCTMIPGTVGGALAGNAGAGNWGICDFVERALIMTRSGRFVELRRGDFEFRYRQSELSQGIVLEADLLLEPLVRDVSRDRSKEFIEKKKGQPYRIPSSGCIFKNPVDPRTGKKISAGMLIDQADLKGYEMNSAMVSKQHANFIVNTGEASGDDFLAMISLIQDLIAERSGIELEVEARIVGGPLTSCVLS